MMTRISTHAGILLSAAICYGASCLPVSATSTVNVHEIQTQETAGENVFSLLLKTGDHGTIFIHTDSSKQQILEPGKAISLKAGSLFSLDVQPELGYRFSHWIIEQNGLEEKKTDTIFSMPESSLTVTAVFEQIPHENVSDEELKAADIHEMYRLYNPNSGEHFYTSQLGEKQNLISLGWKDEGTGWLSPAESDTPVYRLYNPNAGDHHYTTDANERDALVKTGWKDEGIGWYAACSSDRFAIPVYRQYNPNAKAGAHNFTIDEEENAGLKRAGWMAEGIAWHAINPNATIHP